MKDRKKGGGESRPGGKGERVRAEERKGKAVNTILPFSNHSTEATDTISKASSPQRV